MMFMEPSLSSSGFPDTKQLAVLDVTLTLQLAASSDEIPGIEGIDKTHFAGPCAPCERCYNRKSVPGDGDVRGKSVDVLIKIRETRALNPRISDVDEIDPDGVGSIADAY